MKAQVMKIVLSVCVIIAACSLLAGTAVAQAQAPTPSIAPSPAPPQNSTVDLSQQLDLSPLRIVAAQHNQTLKTMDSFARQTIKTITGHASIDGHEPLYTLLDMSFRPELYVQRNIIKIGSVPLRQEFQSLSSIGFDEQQRIIKQGTVSLAFMQRQDVHDLMVNVQKNSFNKTRALGELYYAKTVMEDICQTDASSIPAAIVAPATTAAEDHVWHRPTQMLGASPAFVELARKFNLPPMSVPEHFEDRGPLMDKIVIGIEHLCESWQAGNADKVNRNIKIIADALPQVNPAVYPSLAKRTVEVQYNRWMMLTIPGAAFYFLAFVLFLMSAQAGVGALRLWGLRFMVIALFVHTLGIGVRWWLVGDVFPPIKNEFESVMFSAWFGALVGLILELRRSRGIFGAAASFVGMLSLVAIFTAPFITHTEIGGEISPVQGVLMSYWLYIHVTMVTAAYSLIGMGFALSTWWLVRYYGAFGTLRRVPANLLSSDGVPAGFPVVSLGASPGGTAALGFANTLAMTLFIPRPTSVSAASASPSKLSTAVSSDVSAGSNRVFLATLDMCNLVVLQLAFWVLGVGIVLGAIWADQSWGRPWGWDPKETFALVTWVIYLITVHIRVATEHKAWWTAVLGVIGFFVMLFNWIGVNFLLVGLHSYA